MQARTHVPCLCCGENCMPSELCSVFRQLWHFSGPSDERSRSARRHHLFVGMLSGFAVSGYFIPAPKCPLLEVKGTSHSLAKKSASVMASLFAIFSMHFGHANSSLSGVSRSAAGEMIVPIPRPHCLHVMLSGNDINHALRATYSALEWIWGNRSSMSGWVCTLGKIFVHVSPARNGSRNYALWV